MFMPCEKDAEKMLYKIAFVEQGAKLIRLYREGQ
jgi:hypothetical protein